VDKRSFIGMVEAGEPLIQQAIDAMREYHPPVPDIIPRLHDAKVNGMAKLGININGWKKSTACCMRSFGGAGQNDGRDTAGLDG